MPTGSGLHGPLQDGVVGAGGKKLKTGRGVASPRGQKCAQDQADWVQRCQFREFIDKKPPQPAQNGCPLRYRKRLTSVKGGLHPRFDLVRADVPALAGSLLAGSVSPAGCPRCHRLRTGRTQHSLPTANDLEHL